VSAGRHRVEEADRTLLLARLRLGGVTLCLVAAIVGLAALADVPRAPTGPIITELVSSNGSTLVDSDGDRPDWVEVANPTQEPVELTGWYLSDDLDQPDRWQFPEVLLAPGERLVVFASGKDRADPVEPHTDFAIAAEGEPVLLTEPDGRTVADLVDAVELPRDVSYGRHADDPSRWCYFAFPAPGEQNTRACFADTQLGRPTLSAASGFYGDDVEVTVTGHDPDATILYTLDGSYPDLDGNAEATHTYTGPLLITDRSEEPDRFATIPTAVPFSGAVHGDGWRPPQSPVPKATVLRARPVDGREASATYFVGDHHRRPDWPLVSIAGDGDHFFSDEHGIHVPGAAYQEYLDSDDYDPAHDWRVPSNAAERGRDWERPHQDQLHRAVRFEWCETDGACVDARDVGVRIHGNYSRMLPGKSFRLYARNDYGARTFEYPMFGPDAPFAHRRLLLRNGGNTWGVTNLTDGYVQELIAHLDLDIQAFRPAVVYLNGEYWGILNLRERYDQHYLEAVHGVDPDTTTMLGPALRVEHGPEDANQELVRRLERLAELEGSDPEAVELIEATFDVDELIDYLILQLFISNTDWPANNVRLWRSTDTGSGSERADGRWRFLVFDLDMVGGSAFEHDVAHDNLARMDITADEPLAGTALPLLYQRMLEHPASRQRFLSRFADHLNTTFASHRTLERFDALEALFAPEMVRQIERWGYPASMEEWQDAMDLLRSFFAGRPPVAFEQLLDHHGLEGTVALSVAHDPEQGRVRVNDVVLEDDTPGVREPGRWRATYLQDVPIELEASPHQGYRFVGWTGVPRELADDPVVRLPADRPASAVTARFEPAG